MTDLTTGKPMRVILAFVWPLLLGSLFQLAYNFADSMIVGHTLGEQAFAAVGATNSLVFLILGFAQGMTGGFSVMLAQRFGAKDLAGVKSSYLAGLVLSLAVGLILTLLSLLFLRPFLDVMQTPSDLIDLSHSFLKAMFGGMVATILYNYLSSSIRALGDSRTPLYALMVAVVVNVGLDFVFILNFGWGVFGAGFATILSQLLSVLFLFIHIKRKLPQLHLTRVAFQGFKSDLWAHLKLGLPMGFQFSIIAIGAMILQYALNQLGTAAIAAQAIASRTDQLAMLPILNLGIAISTFTAQNYGARQYQRILDGVKQSTLLAILWSFAFATVLLLGNRFFSALFLPQGSQEIFDLALTYYTINGLCYWIVATLFILRGMLQGLGKSMTTTLGGVMELVFRALVALLGLKYLGFAGVAAAHPAAWIGALLIFVPATYIVRKQFKQRSA